MPDELTLAARPAQIAVVVAVPDARIDQRLVAVEFDLLAVGEFFMRRCAADILCLVLLDLDLHAAQRIDELREGVEIDRHIVVDLDLVIVFDRFHQRRRAAPIVCGVDFIPAILSVDVHIGITVAHKRSERDLARLFVQRYQNHGIRAPARFFLRIHAAEQTIHHILAVHLFPVVSRPLLQPVAQRRRVRHVVHGCENGIFLFNYIFFQLIQLIILSFFIYTCHFDCFGF